MTDDQPVFSNLYTHVAELVNLPRKLVKEAIIAEFCALHNERSARTWEIIQQTFNGLALKAMDENQQ